VRRTSTDPGAQSLTSEGEPDHGLSSVPQTTVMIVEDEAVVSRLAAAILERSGYHVVAAPNGDAAIEILERDSGAFALLILDIVIPGRPALEVLQRFQQLNPPGPAILMSGYCVGDLDAVTGGAKHVLFIQKPFGAGELLQTASTILDSSNTM
jgi:DNA-binding NtrC family response regulator